MFTEESSFATSAIEETIGSFTDCQDLEVRFLIKIWSPLTLSGDKVAKPITKLICSPSCVPDISFSPESCYNLLVEGKLCLILQGCIVFKEVSVCSRGLFNVMFWQKQLDFLVFLCPTKSLYL